MSDTTTNPARLFGGAGRVIHLAHADGERTLCRMSAEGLRDLSTFDPWTRVGLESGSRGPCLRCMTVSAW